MTKPAYFILEIDVHDRAALQPYLDNVGATVAPYAPQSLVHGGTIDPLEGDAPQGNIVVLRFASLTEARAWYGSDAYRAILQHRLSAAHNRAYLVEGLEP